MIKFLRPVTQERLDALWESDGYSQYIMQNCAGERIICNGATMLEAMEDYYLFNDYVKSLGIDPVAGEDQIYSPYVGA